jgi:uncharacterized protein YkwD
MYIDLNSVVEIINDGRSWRGIPAVDLDSALTSVAQKWADHLHSEGRLDHGNSGGRISDVYPGCPNGECLAEGPAGGMAAVGLLMSDPPHRAILLSASYTRVGIGTAPSPIGGLFWVFDFAG